MHASFLHRSAVALALALCAGASVRAAPADSQKRPASAAPAEPQKHPAAAAPAASEPPKRPVVAVLPLRALGAAPEAAAALESQLRNEVAALPEAQLASPEAVTAALKREPDCLAQISCAAAAAARAGARQLILGTVSSLGDAYTLDLKLVDARTALELRRATHPVSGRQELLIELLRATAVELLAPARYAGRLDVQLASPQDGPSGAQVFVDGTARGELPLKAPIAGLVPGQHTLRVSRPGYLDATLFVEVRFDRTTEARVDVGKGTLAGVTYLHEAGGDAGPAGPGTVTESAPPLILSTGPLPQQRAPWLKIAGWSAAGLGVIAAIAGGVVHAKAYATASSLNQKSADNKLTLADLSSYDDISHEVHAARVLYVAGGLLAAGGVGALLWDRHLDHLALEAAPEPSGASVRLSGRF